MVYYTDKFNSLDFVIFSKFSTISQMKVHKSGIEMRPDFDAAGDYQYELPDWQNMVCQFIDAQYLKSLTFVDVHEGLT